MDINKLEQLLKKSESPKLDFKEEFHIKTENEKKELAKDVIAMANTKGGRGYIVFGIRDKTKEIIGIDKSLFNEESIQQIINSRSYPPIPLSVESLNYKGKQIVVLVIYKSELKPHQMIQNGAFYIRRGSTTDVARREEIAGMFQEYGLFSYERVLVPKAPLEEIDLKAVSKFFKEDFRLLEAIGIVGESPEGLCPTIGGILLFGKEPQKYLPHTYIEINHYGKIVIIKGSINVMLDEVEKFLNSKCISKAYPINGLVEAVANAIIHRDYLDISRGITVEITDKNIVISNPGSLVEGNKLYRGKINNEPRRRNPWLYQRAMLIDEKGRFFRHGLGMEKINQAFKNTGKVKYVNLSSKNLFKVILPPWN